MYHLEGQNGRPRMIPGARYALISPGLDWAKGEAIEEGRPIRNTPGPSAVLSRSDLDPGAIERTARVQREGPQPRFYSITSSLQSATYDMQAMWRP